MASAKGKTGKAVIKADTSHKVPSIPELDKEKNDIILGLLSSLLDPVGRHRATYSVKSTGKKSKKRKRTPEAGTDVSTTIDSPTMPDVLNYMTVGINSTTRLLETKVSLSKSGGRAAVHDESSTERKQAGEELAVVFLSKPKDDLMYAHLPVLCYTGSKAQKSQEPIRLVILDSACERTISASLGLPRAGVIGIMENAPGATALIDYVRDNVTPVEIPWLEPALAGKWTGFKLETHVPQNE